MTDRESAINCINGLSENLKSCQCWIFISTSLLQELLSQLKIEGKFANKFTFPKLQHVAHTFWAIFLLLHPTLGKKYCRDTAVMQGYLNQHS